MIITERDVHEYLKTLSSDALQSLQRTISDQVWKAEREAARKKFWEEAKRRGLLEALKSVDFYVTIVVHGTVRYSSCAKNGILLNYSPSAVHEAIERDYASFTGNVAQREEAYKALKALANEYGLALTDIEIEGAVNKEDCKASADPALV